jgi:hypothetical protein
MSNVLEIQWERCSGEAHTNPYIDHCQLCMPYWEDIPTCPDDHRKLADKGNYFQCPLCRRKFTKRRCKECGRVLSERPDGVGFCHACHLYIDPRLTLEQLKERLPWVTVRSGERLCLGKTMLDNNGKCSIAWQYLGAWSSGVWTWEEVLEALHQGLPLATTDLVIVTSLL